jgi:hypothetical protein
MGLLDLHFKNSSFKETKRVYETDFKEKAGISCFFFK